MNFSGSGALGELVNRLGSSEIAGRLVQAIGPTVVQSVLDRLNAGGLGAKVNSWLGKGANEPITVDEMRAALRDQKVQELARSRGIPADKLAEVLAQHLPTPVDKAAWDGTLPAG